MTQPLVVCQYANSFAKQTRWKRTLAMSINTHEEPLVQAAIDGDRTALAQLLLTYYDDLERHIGARISRQLQGLERPEDILQQTFVRAAQAISAFTPQHAGAFRGWLKTIADNLLRDAEKRRRREPRCVPGHGESQSGLLDGVPTDMTSPSVRARRAERADRLRRAMSQLAPDQRDVLHRRYLLGQSLQQIASETGRTVGAVRGLCYRARANLHAVMGNTSLYFSS